MKAGDETLLPVRILRVETGGRVDAQTADGQLIQTDMANFEKAKSVTVTTSKRIDDPENNGVGIARGVTVEMPKETANELIEKGSAKLGKGKVRDRRWGS